MKFKAFINWEPSSFIVGMRKPFQGAKENAGIYYFYDKKEWEEKQNY